MSDSNAVSGLDPESAAEIDLQLRGCLGSAGFENPLENVAVRLESDPAYADAFEACVRATTPELAEEILGGELSPRVQLDERNEALSIAISCVQAESGLADDLRVLPFREDGNVDMEVVLASLTSDGEAWEFLQALESCGGPAAPDVPKEAFGRVDPDHE